MKKNNNNNYNKTHTGLTAILPGELGLAVATLALHLYLFLTCAPSRDRTAHFSYANTIPSCPT